MLCCHLVYNNSLTFSDLWSRGVFALYLKTVENANVVYSVDKLRLKTYMTYSDFTEIEFRFKTVWVDYVEKFYNSYRISEFQYNYVIELCEDKSFWFGFMHNSEKREEGELTSYNFTIEFNPNKIKDNKCLMYLLNFTGNWYIKSFDLACDLRVNILDVVGYDKGRKKELKIISQGFDNRTVYIGKSNNRVKIYNKKIESNLDIVGDLTRVEITCQYDNYAICEVSRFQFSDVFPELFLNDYLYTFKDYEDRTLFCLLYAVQSGLSLDCLTRRYKEKIKNLLTGGQKILFSTKSASDILRQVIYFYFIKNKYVRFD